MRRILTPLLSPGRVRTALRCRIQTCTFCLAFLFFTGVGGGQFLEATVLHVTTTNDSGAGSLRATLGAASDGDTIDFAVGGAITLTSGELPVTKSVTISGPGPLGLALDGNASSTVFHIGAGKTVGISGLTITNAGDVAIHNEGGDLTLSSCVISNNVNNATNLGGGIYNDGSAGSAALHISNCTINNNLGIFGGGIANDGSIGSATVDINSCVISENFASMGGGVYNDGPFGSPGMITASLVDHNHAVNDSGGIFNRDATLTVGNSTLSNNLSDANPFAAAIHNFSARTGRVASIVLSNSTVEHLTDVHHNDGVFENEMASGGGGATIQISHCTFGGEPFVIYNFDCTTIEIGHTILGIGNASGNVSEISNQGGTIISHGYNLSAGPGVLSGAGASCVSTGGLNSTGDQINTDPKFDPNELQDNGGPTPTIALQSNSPAIDAGDPNFASPPSTDQRGYPRKIGSRIDIGAFEYEFGGRLRTIRITHSGSDVTVTFQALEGVTYRLERKGGLTNSTWQSISGVADLTASVTGPAPITDPGGFNSGAAFYRIRLLP